MTARTRIATMFGRRTAMRRVLPVGAVLLLALAAGGCLSEEGQRRAGLSEDGGTCSDLGAPDGSAAHARCMLRQQERRDREQLLNLERARISSETARNNLEMLEAMRERRGRN